MSVHHVTLELCREQLDGCVAFYELLGFVRVQPPQSLADRATWMQSGATQIHLMWVDEPVAMPRGHVAVIAPAYEAVVERLVEAGFEVEPRTRHWGAARSFVRDPAGNLVELMAAPPLVGAG